MNLPSLISLDKGGLTLITTLKFLFISLFDWLLIILVKSSFFEPNDSLWESFEKWDGVLAKLNDPWGL